MPETIIYGAGVMKISKCQWFKHVDVLVCSNANTEYDDDIDYIDINYKANDIEANMYYEYAGLLNANSAAAAVVTNSNTFPFTYDKYI